MSDEILGLYTLTLANMKMTYLLLECFVKEDNSLLNDFKDYINRVDKSLEEIKKFKEEHNE